MRDTKERIIELLGEIKEGETPKICIAFSEYNRYEIFRESYEATLKLLPPNCEVVVVDDGSAKPFKEATFRFKTNQGIAKTKNKCLELLYLKGCEHIFLFDSDTYPIKEDWWKPYIESKEPHLMYIFKDFANGRSLNDTKLIYQDNEKVAYDHPRGCMLYLHRSCLDKVGGMDIVFTKWGFEHGNLSDRIFMSGLTSFRYMDVVNSKGLFYSDDEQTCNAHSTVVGKERRECINANKQLYEERKFKSYYAPFIEKKNAILTCFFNGVTDPQRGNKWVADIEPLKPLIKSLKGTKLIVFHDCLDVEDTESVQYIKVSTSLSPYFQRWITYREWILQNKDEYNSVFCVDATDVEVLREPLWDELGENIWVGDEDELVGCQWMRNHNKGEALKKFVEENKNKQLLNAGILGGKVEIVSEFIRQMIDFMHYEDAGQIDMGLLNYIAYNNWNDKIRTGRQVCTIFKKNEINNQVAWFKHK
jgi:glycosyltransferase involved in cell wall biosynthesis